MRFPCCASSAASVYIVVVLPPAPTIEMRGYCGKVRNSDNMYFTAFQSHFRREEATTGTIASLRSKLAIVPVVASSLLLSIAKDGIMPAFAGQTFQFNHHMLDLGVLFKGVHGHILTHTTLFITTMRHFRG